MAMTDPITEAENGIEALRAFEEIAAQARDGRVRVNVHNGRVTSIVVEKEIDPRTIPNSGIIATLATMLGYGGMEFPIAGGRITGYQALPKRKIT